ncbi:MAG: major capsid protein [Halodesulfovibrio sp.]|uniref:major capsid protein n=1 Tax=Halodesulfovibrio sp. TaxID=1912772 RepID=UPI00359DA251
MFDLKPYFTAVRIAKRFQNAPIIKDVVMDTLFPPEVRQTVESPVIPVSDIQQVVGAVPVVHRGAASIPLRGDVTLNTYVEPLPVRIHDDIDGVTLNNLKLANSTTLEQWAERKQLALRRTARLTAAVLCAQAVFDGSISYPLLESNGSYATYTVQYGAVLTYNTTAQEKWDHADASMMSIYKTLEEMSSKLDKAGHGGEKITFAGVLAFTTILSLIEATDKPKIPVKIMDDGSINLGGHKIKKMAETYPDPENDTVKAKLAPKEIRMIATGNTALFYGPIDDLDSNLQAMPMFVKPLKMDNPSKYMLIGESKPLPAVAPKATIKATVLT